jgi:hypothetical protein
VHQCLRDALFRVFCHNRGFALDGASPDVLLGAEHMSEEFQEPPAAEEVPATKTARKRPAVRKSAKPKPASEGESVAAAPAAEAPPAPRETERESEPVARAEEAAPRESGPDVIPFVVETAGGEPPGNPKKRRRRKKKKHGEGPGPDRPERQDRPQQHSHPSHQHPHAVSPPAEAPSSASPQEAPHASSSMHAAPRPKLDPEQVAKKAWKIFQSEVGEEGLALIDDHDAREISRRCFRLAEIFLEEAARRSR